MTDRTPAPWAYLSGTQRDYTHLYIVHESPTRSQIIADLGASDSRFADGRVEENKNRLANAKFIVRACNAHDKMVQAIEAILFQVEQGKILSRDACITQAREALALAKAQP